MFNIKLVFSFFVLLLTTGAVCAQPRAARTPVSKKTQAVKAANDFVSVEGGFTIDLPKRIHSYASNPRAEGVLLGGSVFKWNLPQGAFMVSFYERAAVPENPRELVERIAESFIGSLSADGSRLLGKRAISIDGHPGIEVKARLKDGSTGIGRYYSINNLTFFLSTGWAGGAGGAAQLKILDSFRLIDKTALLAKMVADATPPALPQTPVVKKLKSDAEDDGLKGKVKSAVLTNEDLSGKWAVGGVKRSSETLYDENGYRTKYVSYNYKGLPMTVAVYGFIDGRRVGSTGEMLSYEFDPPPMKVVVVEGAKKSRSKAAVKPFDARYDTRYEYRYDSAGKIEEIAHFLSNGELSSKTAYRYDANKAEISSIDEDGKVYSRRIEAYDEKFNPVEETYVSTDPKTPDSKYTYTYAEFDEQGNWTKRIVYGKDGDTKDQHYIEYRTIAYYP